MRNSGSLALAAVLLSALLVSAAAAQEKARPERIRGAIEAGDFERAVSLCLEGLGETPGDFELRFLLARSFAYAGRWDEAERVLDPLLEEHPGDNDLALLKARILSWRKNNREAAAGAGRFEFWLGGRNESFGDGRPDYSDLEAAFKFPVFDDRARIILKAARSWRFGGHDDRFGAEAYPRLWKGAYGYVDVLFSPPGGFCPSSSVHLEIYQSLPTRMEASLGARRMTFEGGGVSMLSGSLGAYWGRFHPLLRAFIAFGEGNTEFTWLAGLRRYFGRASFAWVAAGAGARSAEGVSIGDLLGERSWFAEVGADVTFLRRVRLQGLVTLRRESTGLTSTAFSAIAGYRW